MITAHCNHLFDLPDFGDGTLSRNIQEELEAVLLFQ
jgi:hypothetical protein